jgi:hypothetical protein
MRRLLAALLLLAAPAMAQSPQLLGLGAEGGDLRAAFSDGRLLHGADLVGAVLHFDGLDIRIQEVRRDAAVPTAQPGVTAEDVWLFRLSARTTAGAWEELCIPDPAGERHGLVVPGPEGSFGFTCSAGGVGKCIRMGYRPWASLPDGRSLAPFHAACVNLLRGAYGDPERAWTRDGTRVDIYDGAGIQVADKDPEDFFEAGWAPEGAVCLAHPRAPENGSLADILAHAPRLAGRLGPVDCTEAHAAALGALLFNRSRRQ